MMITSDVHARDAVIGLELPMPENKVPEFLQVLSRSTYNAEHLALAVQDRMPTAKYDWLLGAELQAIQHARRYLDIATARAILSMI
jgi:hypothetical protein